MAAVAALYDIHGNLAALEAVLAEVPDDATIVVGGDVVAGGPQPSETLEWLRALGDCVLWLRGNADRELYPGEEGLAPPGALDSTREALSEEQIEFLHELPELQLVDDVLYCHASPRNDVDIFTERTPEERIAGGSGTTVEQVNQLIEARKQMAKMMKMVGSGKIPQLPGMTAGAPTIPGSKPKPSATRKASSKRKKKKARR